MQQALLADVDQLIHSGPAVENPLGIVYSTAPQTGLTLNGHNCIVKGHSDPGIVLREAVAYALADEVGVPIPQGILVSTLHDHLLFGSIIIEGPRDVEPFLKGGRVSNWDKLIDIVTFDIWICNDDRNIGNLVGRSPVASSPGAIDIVAIDFEKSEVLGSKTPTVTVPMVPPESLWPKPPLGSFLSGSKPSEGVMQNYSDIDENLLVSIIAPIQQRLGVEPEWTQSVSRLLAARAKNIGRLIGEVWK